MEAERKRETESGSSIYLLEGETFDGILMGGRAVVTGLIKDQIGI
jgi:hypothetical protein